MSASRGTGVQWSRRLVCCWWRPPARPVWTRRCQRRRHRDASRVRCTIRARSCWTSREMATRSTAFGPCRQGREPLLRGCIRRPMGHPPGRRRVPPYAARRHFARSLSVPADGKKQRQRDLSPPLLTYSALGGLRQDPGGGAKSSAEATTCGNGDTTCVCCRRIGDEVTLNQWWDRQCGRECSGRWCGCARRPTGRSGRPTRQREGGQRRGGA